MWFEWINEWTCVVCLVYYLVLLLNKWEHLQARAGEGSHLLAVSLWLTSSNGGKIHSSASSDSSMPSEAPECCKRQHVSKLASLFYIPCHQSSRWRAALSMSLFGVSGKTKVCWLWSRSRTLLFSLFLLCNWNKIGYGFQLVGEKEASGPLS